LQKHGCGLDTGSSKEGSHGIKRISLKDTITQASTCDETVTCLAKLAAARPIIQKPEDFDCVHLWLDLIYESFYSGEMTM
jgi:hypothetical protein